MSSRIFNDRAGVLWTVWDVVPGAHAATPRQLSTLPEGMSGGWLCFESQAGKRRLYPIPSDWEELPADRLELLCRTAVPVGRERLADSAHEPAPEAALRPEPPPADAPPEPEPALG
ncbi:MAG TPA: hypothetical protein VF746_31075 [Longimicrobium sp.]|jgi:hypothetical protein